MTSVAINKNNQTLPTSHKLNHSPSSILNKTPSIRFAKIPSTLSSETVYTNNTQSNIVPSKIPSSMDNFNKSNDNNDNNNNNNNDSTRNVIPPYRNKHKHKRSFAMSGDFDFLRQDQQQQEIVSNKEDRSNSSGSTGSARNSKFFLSNGDDTTFNDKGVPNAMIDLDDIVAHTQNRHSISSVSSGSNKNLNKAYSYNNIRSKSNIVYSSTSAGAANNTNNNNNNNKGSVSSDYKMLHKRSESAPAELDNDNSHSWQIGYSNNGNRYISNNNIREEDNEDFSNNNSPLKPQTLSPLQSGRPNNDLQQKEQEQQGKEQLQFHETKQICKPTTPALPTSSTYRNIGKQKERYSNYNSYITGNISLKSSSPSNSIASGKPRPSSASALSGTNTASSNFMKLDGARKSNLSNYTNSYSPLLSSGRKSRMQKPFNFQTTMYDVDNEIENSNDEDEEEEEEAIEDPITMDRPGDISPTNSRPQSQHTKSFSISIGEQQNGNVTPIRTHTPDIEEARPIPSAILMGEPLDDNNMKPHKPALVEEQESIATQPTPDTPKEDTKKKRRSSVFFHNLKKSASSQSLSSLLRINNTNNTDTTTHENHGHRKISDSSCNDDPEKKKKNKLLHWLFKK